jgi:hypothetical protein
MLYNRRSEEFAMNTPIGEPRRLVSLALIALAAAGCTGCGLGDYEDLMRREQSRVTSILQENALLGEPVQPPSVNLALQGSQPLQQFDVFFRGPKSFKYEPQPKIICTTKNLFLFGYGDPDARRIWLGSMAMIEKQDADFYFEVWTAFRVYLTKRLPKNLVPVEMPRTKSDDRTPLQLGKEPPKSIKFESFVWDEPEFSTFIKDPNAPPEAKDLPRYYFNFSNYTSNNPTINATIRTVVIFQVPRSKLDEPGLENAMNASLTTLAFEQDSRTRRMLYNRWKGK